MPRLADGTHTLTSVPPPPPAMGMTLLVDGNTARSLFDTFTYQPPPVDMYVADHVSVTLRFPTSTTFQGSSNGTGFSGTCT